MSQKSSKNTLSQKLALLKKPAVRRVLLEKAIPALVGTPRLTYSQTGEDIIINHIFDSIGIEKPSFIDIGAHHPTYLNNTAFFSKRGSKGINIEPDPALFAKFKRSRTRDINLNVGIAAKEGELDFYIMNVPTLNTFSKEEARAVSNEQFHIKETCKITVTTVEAVIDRYWKGIFPDFLSLDVEGLDFEILSSINFKKASPIVICIETVKVADGKYVRDNEEVSALLAKHGYILFADTFINSIYLKKSAWSDLG